MPGQDSQLSGESKSVALGVSGFTRRVFINNRCPMAIKGFGHMLLFSSLLLSSFLSHHKKNLYLFIPRGTIKVHKITSCVTSMLSWNTKCAISSKPGRALHRGVLGDRLELMAFVRKAEELSYVALCSCGMEREQSRRRTGLDWWSP